MIEIDWTRCGTVPRPHQPEGVRWLLRADDPAHGRIIKNVSLLGDDVGVGKSKQIVDTAELLYEAGMIDTVVVTVPAFARGVWANPDPELGEIAKHGWPSIQNNVLEYSVRQDWFPKFKKPGLLWIVTNYEFIRRLDRLFPLVQFLQGRRYWLTTDESWALSDHTTAQWEAVSVIRHHGWVQKKYLRGKKMDPIWKAIHDTGIAAERITLLNGTPVADTPMDLFAQGRLMHSTIPGFKYFSHFRARYAVLQPNVSFPLVTGYQNLEELRARFAPYVLRREVEQCEVLDPIMIEARLTEKTWRLYTQMRNDMVAWLGTNEASVSKQALTKGLRLAQITSGFLGGIRSMDMEADLFKDLDMSPQSTEIHEPTQDIGREKLDALLAFLQQIRPLPNRVMIWSRFRPEIERTARVLSEVGDRTMYKLYGNQSTADREAAKWALHPKTQIDGPVGVVGHAAAGGAALDFSGASLDISMSHDFSLRVYTQKRGRINRGIRRPIQYVDVVATGPKGQRTCDHHVLAALRGKQDISAWTSATWSRKLQEE